MAGKKNEKIEEFGSLKIFPLADYFLYRNLSANGTSGRDAVL
jgi:hypothetical protein